MRFIERHSSCVFLFCLVGVLVGGALILSPSEFGTYRPSRSVALQIAGAFIGVSYVIAIGGYIYARVTGKWSPAIRTAVLDAENRLAKANEHQT